MIQRILVGLDEGDLAAVAVDVAVDLARTLEARVEFLHAVPGFWGWTALTEPFSTKLEVTLLEDARRDRLQFLEDRLGPHGFDRGRLEEDTIVTLERPAEALVHRAHEPGCDLIVLGSHDAPTVFDFGNTARAVLAASPCPVWIQRSAAKPIQNVLAPIHNLQENQHSLSVARDLARALGAKLTVLHSFVAPGFTYPPQAISAALPDASLIQELRDSERAEFQQATASFDFGGVPVDFVFEEGRPAERILEREDADLIVMGTQTQSRFVKAVLGSESFAVLKEAQVPVLVCPSDGADE